MLLVTSSRLASSHLASSHLPPRLLPPPLPLLRSSLLDRAECLQILRSSVRVTNDNLSRTETVGSRRLEVDGGAGRFGATGGRK